MPTTTQPRLKHLNWNLLRTFLVIVEERSITRAAERLLVRQPSVTAALQKLEETLGTQLIKRDSRSFLITTAGEALRRECLEIFHRVERIGQRLSMNEDSLTGQVRILTVTQVQLPAFDRALGLMHRRHPAITLRIEVANSQEITRAVAQRSVPFGLCLLPRPLAALRCTFLLRERFGIFCGATHPLFGRDDVDLDELRAEAFVAFTCGQDGALEPMVALREGAGLGARIVGASPNLEEVQRMIASGIGIGLLPVHAAERAVELGLLWGLPVLQEQLGADLYFLSNPESAHEPAEAAFLATFEALLFDYDHRDPLIPTVPGATPPAAGH